MRARRRRAAGHARRVGSAPQPFARGSRKRCAPRELHLAVFAGRQVGALALRPAHLHSAHSTLHACACKPGRFRSWCFLRNATVQRAVRLVFSLCRNGT